MCILCERVMTSVLCSTGTPGSEGIPVTPSSTPRASTATEEPRQIKTEPDTHSLYTHHSTHAQVGNLFSWITESTYIQNCF